MCQTHSHSHPHAHPHVQEWYSPTYRGNRPLRVGVAGPVGSGKTALVEKLCWKLQPDLSVAVVTNDIYTREDAQILCNTGVLPEERIIGVETGGCPHTAIREDASMNLEAIAELEDRFPDLDIIFVESGGDNLAAAFSPELVDVFIYVIDVAQGEKIPRKGGPGITQSDLLVINKVDLALLVHASLEVMAEDSRRVRQGRPFMLTNLLSESTHEDGEEVAAWLRDRYGVLRA